MHQEVPDGNSQINSFHFCVARYVKIIVTLIRNTERMEEFKYLETTLTHQNSIQEENKSKLKLGSACYHSVQNLWSSSLLSKNLNIKIY